MPAPTYTYSNLKDEVFDPIVYPNIDSQLTTRKLLNRGVRNVMTKLDLRTTKRQATAALVFDDIYERSCPTDLKGIAVIDLAPQVNRTVDSELTLTTPEEFDRRKSLDKRLLAVRDRDSLRTLLNSLFVDGEEVVVSTLDSLTAGGGTWSAVGDATNLSADADDYVKGAGSIRWDIGSTGGTTAGIQNTGLTSFDFSDYVDNNRSVFHWAYITSATNLTNWKLRIGSSSSNYYEITVTATNEGTAFSAGWNLLRFDFLNKSTTGSPDSSAGDYASIFMTKAAGKINETGYRSDHILLAGGVYYDLIYYSKYPWQTSGGTWIPDSTTSTDLVVADSDEFDIYVLSCKVEEAKERKDYDVLATRQQDLNDTIKQYRLIHPSEAKLLTNSRWESPMIQN